MGTPDSLTPLRRALRGPGELEWLDRLEVEHQNIRAAIDWYAQHDPFDALGLAAAMSRFCGVRGHFTEGRRRLKVLLELSGNGTSTRVKALTGAASLAIDRDAVMVTAAVAPTLPWGRAAP